MKISIFQDLLIHRIKKFGLIARDHKQIHRRLEQLLPDRFKALLQSHMHADLSLSRAYRLAAVSEQYKAYIQELIEVSARGHEARIQYETHMMLFEARRSLRLLRK